MANYLHVAKGVFAGGAFWSFTMKSSGSISESAAETAWAGAINGFFATTGVAALYSNTVELTETSTSTASATWKQTTKTRTTHTTSGSASTQELPVHDAMIVTYRAATADKSSHGRWFLPAPVAAALSVGSGGHLSASSITTLTGALTTARNAITGAGLSPLILTRKATKGGLPANSTRLVTEWELVTTLAVQNRRGDKLIPSRTSF